jgi:hypothetical protein
LPGSCVWTYGYPADVFTDIRSALKDTARNLLEEMRDRNRFEVRSMLHVYQTQHMLTIA